MMKIVPLVQEYLNCMPVEKEILRMLKNINVINPCFKRCKLTVLIFDDIVSFDIMYKTRATNNYTNNNINIILQLLTKLDDNFIYLRCEGKNDY